MVATMLHLVARRPDGAVLYETDFPEMALPDRPWDSHDPIVGPFTETVYEGELALAETEWDNGEPVQTRTLPDGEWRPYRPKVGGDVAAFHMWKGICGHVWDRRVDDTDVCPRCLAETQAAGLLQQVAERDALFDLQWTRTRAADKLWHAAHPGTDGVWPDLGELIGWLAQGHELVTEWLAWAENDRWYARLRVSRSEWGAAAQSRLVRTTQWLTDARPTHDLPSDRRLTPRPAITGDLARIAIEVLTPWHGAPDDDSQVRKCIDIRCGATSRLVTRAQVVALRDATVVLVEHNAGCAVAEFMRRVTAAFEVQAGDALRIEPDLYNVRATPEDVAKGIPTVERMDGSLWREATSAEEAAANAQGKTYRAPMPFHVGRGMPDLPGPSSVETVQEAGTE